jgi:diguanylate cyclase (GGDEF)-like protein/PAS domain S-box-containing protein
MLEKPQAVNVKPPVHSDTRDRSRFVSLLLLLPMVAVAGASIGGLAVSNAASTSLQRAEAIDVQLANVHEHVRDAALSGTAFLVSHAADDAVSLKLAGQQVDVELATLKSSPDLSSSEESALAVVLRAWHVTSSARSAVLASGAESASPVAVLLRPVVEAQLNTSLTEVTAQLTTLEALNAAEVAARQHQGDATQAASALAIAVAIMIGFVGALWLLRQLKERQETVRRRERRLSALVEHASDGILVIDGDGQVAFVTPSFGEEFFDAGAGAMNFDGMVHPDDREHTSKAWQRVTSGGGGTVSEVEARLLRLDGEWRHAWVKLTNRLDDPGVDGIVLNVTDVSDRHEFEKKLTHQALHDALTGLPNRDLLRHRMERATANAGHEEHSVLYLDCDDLKRINDTFGHAAGDQYLAEVGRRFVACVRPEDTVARLGGDEFAILQESTGAAGAVLVANRIIGTLGSPIVIRGKALHPSASIGVASGQLGALHPETLLADADLAMYFAKREGKGGYRVFAEAMRTDLVDRLALGEDLSQAIESASLQVEYQPIIDMQTGAIVGAEALARWHHPSRGWVGPDTFIPLAEELGLVERIDQWVLREACTMGRAWAQDGLPQLKMAVNLSGRDLEQPDLVEQIARILHETEFPAGQLELELTEGVAIYESSGAQETLKALQSLGVHLAIDDFGTGYSALSRLRNLPFDQLKVDKAFVDDIDLAQHAPMLVDTILEMAHVLGLEVVAEGVETATQADYLRERGCDFAQGYLFSRPLGAAEMAILLKGQLLEVLALPA